MYTRKEVQGYNCLNPSGRVLVQYVWDLGFVYISIQTPKNKNKIPTWQLSALQKLRQENQHEFRANLNHIIKSLSQNNISLLKINKREKIENFHLLSTYCVWCSLRLFMCISPFTNFMMLIHIQIIINSKIKVHGIKLFLIDYHK